MVILFLIRSALLNPLNTQRATRLLAPKSLQSRLLSLFGFIMHGRLKVIDILLVLPEGSCGAISGNGALWDDTHDHELGGRGMHPLQVLLLHALCVEERVVIGAARSSAGAVGLVQVVACLGHVFRAFRGADTALETSELVLKADLLLLGLALAGDSCAVGAMVMEALVLEGRR